jgi:Right handed beta helix region/Pectate lyase superfamily protein
MIRNICLILFILLTFPINAATVHELGAVGDGKTDDTLALQRAVDSGLGDIILPKGVYLITKTITVELDRVGFTSIRGTGTATIKMAGEGPAIKFVGTHGGTAAPKTVKPNIYEKQRTPIIEGIEIVGAHPKASGIEATGTMKLIVDKVTVRDAQNGLRLFNRNRNVIVSNSHFYHNRQAGIILDECDLHQINVVGCHISYNGTGGVVVRGGGVRNLQIGTCDIEGNVVNVLIDSAGSVGGTAEVTIIGCTLQHSGGKSSANVRFIGTDAKGKRNFGHLTIVGNVMSDTETNVDLRGLIDVAMTGNSLWKAYRYNLRAVDCRNLTIGANTFGRNERYGQGDSQNGVLFENCKNLTISGLLIEDVRHSDAAVIFKNCQRVNLTGSTIVDCPVPVGILFERVSQSRISGCVIRSDRRQDKSWAPIRIKGDEDCLVSGNIVDDPIQSESDRAVVKDNLMAP